VPNNYGFLADFVPTSQEIITNGFPVADGSTLQTFNAVAQDYSQALNGIATPPDGPAWYNADFTATVPFAPAVGQGFALPHIWWDCHVESQLHSEVSLEFG
jgi:hypothetical protein